MESSEIILVYDIGDNFKGLDNRLKMFDINTSAFISQNAVTIEYFLNDLAS